MAPTTTVSSSPAVTETSRTAVSGAKPSLTQTAPSHEKNGPWPISSAMKAWLREWATRSAYRAYRPSSRKCGKRSAKDRRVIR